MSRRAFIAGLAALASIPLVGTARAHHRPDHAKTAEVVAPVLTVTHEE